MRRILYGRGRSVVLGLYVHVRIAAVVFVHVQYYVAHGGLSEH